jgi:hypothetical protein
MSWQGKVWKDFLTNIHLDGKLLLKDVLMDYAYRDQERGAAENAYDCLVADAAGGCRGHCH